MTSKRRSLDFTREGKESSVAAQDPEPLLRGSTNETARSLLASGREDAPDPNARDRMLAALAAAPAAPESGGGLRQLLRSGGYYVHGIGAALILSGGAALVFGTSSDRRLASAENEVPVASVPAVAVAAPVSATADEEAIAIPTLTPDALPSVAAVEPTAAPRGAPPKRGGHVGGHVAEAPPSAPESTLAREIAQVEAARTSLAAGAATKTLSLLDQYEREFPTGAFAVEVAVLRIEALARAGRTDEARRLGSQFLATHRRGAFARRVAITLESTNANGASASASASVPSSGE